MIHTLKTFVHQVLRIPPENRRNVQNIADTLKILHPEAYALLIRELACYPLAELLPAALRILEVAEIHRVWLYGLVQELHLRSREAAAIGPLNNPLTGPPAPR